MTSFVPGYMLQGNANVVTTGAVIAANVSVTGTGLPTNGLFLSSSNNLAIATNSTQVLTVTSAGLVGINTTAPVALLNTNGGGIVVGSDGDYFGGGAYYASGNWKNSVTNEGGWVLRNTGGVFTIWTGSNAGTAGSNFSTFSEVFRVSNTGNVGIATNNPLSTLHVAGNIIGSELRTNSSSDSLELYAGNTFSSLGDGAISIRGTASGYNNGGMEFYAGGSERMRIISSGNIGINATSPNASLQVNGGIYNSSQSIIGATTTLTTACFGTLVEVNATSAITITLPPISNGACFQFWLNTGQNITITTPSGAIYGPSGASAASQVLNISTGGSWYFFSCDGFNWFMTSVPWMSPTGSLLIGTTTAVGKITNYNGPISSGRLSSTNNWDGSNGSLNITSLGDGGSRAVITFGNSTTTAQNWHLVIGDNSNSVNWYSGNYGSGTIQMYLKNNGGIANYSGNNVNLSDARLKSNIELAGDYLDRICAIPVKNFHFTRDADGHYCLGVIAQDVEAVAPELVNQDGFGETPEDGVPYKTIYQTDLQYALMKSIQELKAIVDAQAAEIQQLKVKIGS